MKPRKLSSNWKSTFEEAVMRGKFMLHPQMAAGVLHNHMNLITNLNEGLVNLEQEVITEANATIYKTAGSDSRYFDLEEAPEGVVAVIPLKGSMMKYGGWWHYGTTEIAAMIIEAAQSSKVVAIVIDGDTGGGHVNSIAPLLHATFEVQKIGKPIIGSGDLIASAGYYFFAAFDSIIANNNISAEFGSIGVMMTFWDVIPYYEKEGFKYHEIYSNHSEEKGKAWQLALEGKYDQIKEEELDPLAIQFQNDVKKFRGDKLNLDRPGLLNGIMLYAEEAKEEGLIDHVGDQDLAVEIATIKAEERKLFKTPK